MLKSAFRFLALTALVSCVLGAGKASADGARDWLNVPKDMNFFYLYYTYTNSETSIDSPLPVDGADVSASVPILRLARSFDFFGKTGGVQLIVLYAFINMDLQGTRIKRDIDGLGDLQFVLLRNLYGAPALSKAEFANWQAGQYLTAAMTFTAPTGDYDRKRLVNPGKNRWAFKPQLSYGAPLGTGKWFSTNANVEFYTDNDEFAGRGKLEQYPFATFDAHYSFNVNKALWISADAIYNYGGETKTNGRKKDNAQSTLRLGLSASMNFTPVDAISVSVNSTTWKKDYTAAGQNFMINYNHAW